ncbi:MAG: hypothetical protein J5626_05775, partial [Lachnospiraceae bacterium]|nr:hypothetical protein [Lachnospiraceae bacterium]
METLQVAGAGISQPTAASAVTDNVINVKSYGAKGDGKTEDTKAIYKAFKDAKTSGKTLYFPKGKYLIEWGQIYLELNEKGIKIQGDGKQESVIKLKETHNGGEFGNGIVLLSRSNPNIAPNVSISNIGITYDVYNSSLVFTRASTLLGLNGYFGKIYVDNCYFHIGGTSNNLPEDTCLFWHLGADLVSIKNCLIENFTHNEAGGDIWIMTDDNDGTKITNHKINKVIIQGNEIKSSNRDEAIGLYPSAKNTKPTDCFKSVLITENIIRHKKYNNNSKDCSPTDGLVTVFLPNDSVPPVNASIVISNNKIQSQMASQEVIRVVGFSGVDVANNKITVKGTTQKEILRTIYFGRDTKGVVENNTMDYSEITWCEVRVSLAGTAEAEWKNNDINTGGNFGISPTDGAKLVLKKNRITTLNDGIFVVRKNGDDARVFLYDNVVYGKTRLNYLYGTD